MVAGETVSPAEQATRPDAPARRRPGRLLLRGGTRPLIGRLALAVASAFLTFLAFPPNQVSHVFFSSHGSTEGLWPLAPVGVAGFTLAIRGTRARTGAWLGLAFGAPFFLTTLAGIVKIGADGWIILSLVEALYFAPLGAAIAVVTRPPANGPYDGRAREDRPAGGTPRAGAPDDGARRPMARLVAPAGRVAAGRVAAGRVAAACWPVSTALLWVAEELVRGRTPFGGFPWARLAFSQTSSPFTPYAALGGAPLVTFVTALAGGLLAYAVVRSKDLRTAGLAVGAVLAVAAAGPALRYFPSQPAPTGGRSVTVAVVQGNVPRLGLDFLGQRKAVLDNHARATHELAAEIRANKVARPDLVIWPENSSDLDPYADPDARQTIDAAVKDVGVPVLVGAVIDAGDGKHVENRGIVWDPRTGPGEYYIKRHPVPFGEYLPFRDLLTKLITRFERIPYDYLSGKRPGLLRLGPVEVGDVICFEVAYDGIVRDVSSAPLLVVQTNNATYGHTSLPWQQVAMTRLRAVEHGRSVLVAATSGITAIVAPDGHVVDQSAEFVPYVQVARVPALTSRTLADHLGAAPEWSMAAAGIAALAAVGVTGAGAGRMRRVKEKGRGD
jgi:apolipoprotein N-acyltransferase